jgi:hypothetical protein
MKHPILACALLLLGQIIFFYVGVFPLLQNSTQAVQNSTQAVQYTTTFTVFTTKSIPQALDEFTTSVHPSDPDSSVPPGSKFRNHIDQMQVFQTQAEPQGAIYTIVVVYHEVPA